MLRRARSECLVRFIRHCVHARGVDPAVVEVKQRADRDGVVDGFIRPTRGVEWPHILGGDFRRLGIDLVDEAEEHLLFFGKGRCFQVVQDAPHQFLAPQQFRRNCGVVLRSKRAVVPVRGERGDQLADTGAQRTIAAHDLVRECAKVRGRLWPVPEQMPDLWVFGAGGLRDVDEVGRGPGLRIALNFRQEHGFHVRSACVRTSCGAQVARPST